jgi:lipopolysaccharide transport system ATP-binding protein
MTPAISIENLGKVYRVDRLSPRRGGYSTLRDDVVNLMKAPLRRLRGDAPSRKEDFWALRDISFDVNPGEAVGIIGRNGAGKSTLLKILSRITKPSRGRITTRGRVASLLEVGTGFHAELTGRENIYMNGSILGMSRREIDRSFDAIVDFSGVEQFLDLPVKRYSSGMQVRLAFAVGAHLDPEILIVDEVLAVGDYEFQKKCLGKMDNVVKSGRTVLFVSHNLDAVARLTSRSVLLKAGSVIEDGPSLEVIRSYLSTGSGTDALWEAEGSDPANPVSLRSVRLVDRSGQTCAHFDAADPIEVEITLDSTIHTPAQVAFRLVSGVDGQVILTSGNGDPDNRKCVTLSPGTHQSTCMIAGNLLRPGIYNLLVAINKSQGGQFDLVDQAVAFEVTPVGSLINNDNRLGVIAPSFPWETQRLDSHQAVATRREGLS